MVLKLTEYSIFGANSCIKTVHGAETGLPSSCSWCLSYFLFKYDIERDTAWINSIFLAVYSCFLRSRSQVDKQGTLKIGFHAIWIYRTYMTSCRHPLSLSLSLICWINTPEKCRLLLIVPDRKVIMCYWCISVWLQLSDEIQYKFMQHTGLETTVTIHSSQLWLVHCFHLKHCLM